ncbi:MAG: LysM domain-containing protein [Planctomycetota bacterium]
MPFLSTPRWILSGRVLTAAALAPGFVLAMGCQTREPVEVDMAPPPPAYRPAASTVLRADLERPQPAAEPVEITAADAGFGPADSFAGPIGDEPASVSGRTYTIQKGDKLWNIARREYGSGQRWVDIADANPDVNPDKLPIGLTIVLPE